MAQVTESDYRTAQKGNAKVRQEFLEAVDLEDAAEFVSQVKYDPKFKQRKPDRDGLFTYMCHRGRYTWASPSGEYIRGTVFQNSIVLVCSRAFSDFSWKEFLSGFIDHERQHSRQYKLKTNGYNNIQKMKGKLENNTDAHNYYMALIEVSAYANQLARAKRRSLSPEYKKALSFELNRHLKLIKKANKIFSDEKGFRQDLSKILCNSDGDNLVRQHLGIN